MFVCLIFVFSYNLPSSVMEKQQKPTIKIESKTVDATIVALAQIVDNLVGAKIFTTDYEFVENDGTILYLNGVTYDIESLLTSLNKAKNDGMTHIQVCENHYKDIVLRTVRLNVPPNFLELITEQKLSREQQALSYKQKQIELLRAMLHKLESENS